jgi:hypothetical protein
VRLVRCKSQHDEVSIKASHAVTGVWIILGLTAHPADVLHDLVFSFSGHFMAAKDDAEGLPRRVIFLLAFDEILQVLGHRRHELRTGCNLAGSHKHLALSE